MSITANMYSPQIFDSSNPNHSIEVNNLRSNGIDVLDSINSQLLELMLCRNPSKSKTEVLEGRLVESFLEEKGKTIEKYGNWVYYPWKNQLIHILPEEEFVEVRTNRNKFKITQEEQEILRSKKIGIPGLSVGRSIAITIALERIAGEIRLADFDNIELSNLNRIKAPLSEIGLNKAVAAAREIAEIDPYIKVLCFEDGLTEINLEEFFTISGNVDLFIEECDDVKIKILSRLKCKKLQIPVLMETNDNCVIDIERFDLEPERPIFHGKLNSEDIKQGINAVTIHEKIAVISKIIDIENLSDRMKTSLLEISRSTRSWPQLASEVEYGGGIVNKIAREIFLGFRQQSIQENGHKLF